MYYIIVSSLVLRLCLIVLSPVKASALDRNNQCTIVNKYCKIFSLNKVFEVEVEVEVEVTEGFPEPCLEFKAVHDVSSIDIIRIVCVR